MFNDLSSKVGADSTGITKDELEDYLKKLKSSGSSDSKETDMVSDLIDNFDSVSANSDTITSDNFNSYVQNKMSSQSGNEPQDSSTVTSDQLKSPIDIKV